MGVSDVCRVGPPKASAGRAACAEAAVIERAAAVMSVLNIVVFLLVGGCVRRVDSVKLTITVSIGNTLTKNFSGNQINYLFLNETKSSFLGWSRF